MIEYLAMRIKSGHMAYDAVIKKYPNYKNGIDEILDEGEVI